MILTQVFVVWGLPIPIYPLNFQNFLSWIPEISPITIKQPHMECPQEDGSMVSWIYSVSLQCKTTSPPLPLHWQLLICSWNLCRAYPISSLKIFILHFSLPSWQFLMIHNWRVPHHPRNVGRQQHVTSI